MLLRLLAFGQRLVSRRRRAVVLALVASSVLYAVVQVVHLQEQFSPLQALSSAEAEAGRLLRFMTSYHYQCNTTIHTSNASDWVLCMEPDFGINPDPSVGKTAYSIGPLPDYSFELLLGRNLSVHQYIFLDAESTGLPQPLSQLNATFIHTAIVPNDPADFGRNAYNLRTVNSVMEQLGHQHIDLLKLQAVQDMGTSHEILGFMARDGILSRFKQIHVMIEIDKVEESLLYGWYRTFHSMFHVGFLLYHTAASSPLCLQVTMMESCRYFTSWVRNPGPQTFILYPPAIDGSEEYEVQRLQSLLTIGQHWQKAAVPVSLSHSTSLRLSHHIVSADSCTILVFKYRVGYWMSQQVSVGDAKCSVVTMSPVSNRHNAYDFSLFDLRTPEGHKTVNFSEGLSYFAGRGQSSVLYIDLGQSGWMFLTLLLDSGVLKDVDQMVFVTPIFLFLSPGNRQPWSTLRYRYSELKRVSTFHFKLTEALTHSSLQPHADLWWLTFVKE